MNKTLLIDLGGTNCRIGLGDQTGVDASTVKSFKNADFECPEDLMATYLRDQGSPIINALCAGVAGPVQDGQAQLTNHHWHLDSGKLLEVSGAKHACLINDLQAQAYALDDLPDASVHKLILGHADPIGPRMVFCLGTGCNIAMAHRIGGSLFVPASESGHASLPDLPDHRSLYDQLRLEEPHLPIEAALSARGLSRVHAYVTGEDLSSDQIMRQEPKETIELFLQILGLCAGNLCLANMATGGMYLIGGLARAVAPYLASDQFKKSFCARGPYAHIMERISVSVVVDDNAGLLGCARFLRQMES